jgi:hypothetical protein
MRQNANVAKKKPDPWRVRLQFAGAGPTITFQRGTADNFAVAASENQTTASRQQIAVCRAGLRKQ